MVNAYACNRIQPNLETLQQIAEILQVDLKDLITDKRIGDMKQFSEATRVQMPAMVHLTRIGYTYFGKLSEDKNGTVYDSDTNILLQVFEQQFKNLNPGHEGEFLQILKDIRKELNDDDLGRGFYNRLKAVSPVKLIDFDNIGNNTFHFTAEFTCKNGQDEFRPDITLFVNGLPLCFVEVKKPNNQGGMLAESARMNKERFPNKKFRRFINITQLMIFSNNMEYDALGGIVPIQGLSIVLEHAHILPLTVSVKKICLRKRLHLSIVIIHIRTLTRQRKSKYYQIIIAKSFIQAQNIKPISISIRLLIGY